MKIGIFDSGLGGLVVLRGLLSNKSLSSFDFVYLGDTKNLPYGNKTQNQIFDLTKKAVEYLFKQNCELVIIACNTSSSQALRKIQREWLPKSKYKNRRVLGIIRPTVESVGKANNILVIGTSRTIDSKAYITELHKLNPNTKVRLQETPLLVPMIESGNLDKLDEVLHHYLSQNLDQDALILGCTHYGLIKKQIQKVVGKRVKVISQEDLLPGKLKSYLIKHKEVAAKLLRNGKVELLVTKISPRYEKLTKEWFGEDNRLRLIKIN